MLFGLERISMSKREWGILLRLNVPIWIAAIPSFIACYYHSDGWQAISGIGLIIGMLVALMITIGR